MPLSSERRGRRQRSVIKRIGLSHFINRETGEAATGADKRAGSRGRSVRFEGNSIDRPIFRVRAAPPRPTKLALRTPIATQRRILLDGCVPLCHPFLPFFSTRSSGSNSFGPRCMIYFGFCTVQIGLFPRFNWLYRDVIGHLSLFVVWKFEFARRPKITSYFVRCFSTSFGADNSSRPPRKMNREFVEHFVYGQNISRRNIIQFGQSTWVTFCNFVWRWEHSFMKVKYSLRLDNTGNSRE